MFKVSNEKKVRTFKLRHQHRLFVVFLSLNKFQIKRILEKKIIFNLWLQYKSIDWFLDDEEHWPLMG